MSRASSGAMDSSNLTLSQQQRLQRLRVRVGPCAALQHHSPACTMLPTHPVATLAPRLHP